VKKISGAARASGGATIVRTSRGLAYAERSTRFSCSFGYDSENEATRQHRSTVCQSQSEDQDQGGSIGSGERGQDEGVRPYTREIIDPAQYNQPDKRRQSGRDGAIKNSAI
jgi:hypothetical protein